MLFQGGIDLFTFTGLISLIKRSFFLNKILLVKILLIIDIFLFGTITGFEIFKFVHRNNKPYIEVIIRESNSVKTIDI